MQKITHKYSRCKNYIDIKDALNDLLEDFISLHALSQNKKFIKVSIDCIYVRGVFVWTNNVYRKP